MHPWLTSYLVAHRGLHAPDAPENSLAAAEAALGCGFAVECDVRLAADGSVAVFHDLDLARMTGAKGRLDQLDLAGLKALRLGSTRERVPLLAELLDLVRGRVPLYIELKTEARPEALGRAVLKVLDGYRGEYALTCFDPFVLGWCRRNAPDVPRIQVATDFRHKPHSRLVERRDWRRLRMNHVSRPHALAFDLRAMPDARVARFRKLAGPVLAWTVRSMDELRMALTYADNVIFEGFLPPGPHVPRVSAHQGGRDG